MRGEQFGLHGCVMQRPIIPNDVVRILNFDSEIKLGGHHFLGCPLGEAPMFMHSPSLHGGRAGDHKNRVEITFGVCLEKQRNIHEQPSLIFTDAAFLDSLQPGGANFRVKDLLQLFSPGFFGENNLPQCRAVDRSILRENICSKLLLHCRQHFSVFRQQRVCRAIRVEYFRVQGTSQNRGDGGFARRDPPRHTQAGHELLGKRRDLRQCWRRNLGQRQRLNHFVLFVILQDCFPGRIDQTRAHENDQIPFEMLINT